MQVLTVVIRRDSGDEEGKFLGHVDAPIVLLSEVGLAMGVAEDDVDDFPPAAQTRPPRFYPT